MANRIVKFERHGCNPCIAVGNYLDDLGVDYETINVEENVDKAIEFQVMSTPITFVLNEENEIIKRSRGYNPEELDEMAELI